MTRILVDLCDALRSAGAPEDKTQAAAASVISGTENDALATKADLQAEISSLRAEFGEHLSAVETGIRYVQWTNGTVGVGVFLLVIESF